MKGVKQLLKVTTGFIHGYVVKNWDDLATYAIEAEKLGIESIFSPEAWGYDGLTPLAYLAAKTSKIKLGTGILQIGSRTATNTAMGALSMNSLSNGRFILGLGTSGPQVMEGFHGIIFDEPVRRTKENIDVIKMIFRGEKVSYQGKHLKHPSREGQGVVMKNESDPDPDIPIWIASLGPKNLELTGAIADGWKGTSFTPETAESMFQHIRKGAEDAGRNFSDITINVGGTVYFTDDVDKAVEELKPRLAFTLGAMGSRKFNFYNAAFSRAGYADEAKHIQDLWIEGKRDEARRLVPAEMVIRSGFIGTDEMIKERIRLYRDAGVNQISAQLRFRQQDSGYIPTVTERIDTLSKFVDLVDQVNKE